MTSRPPLCPDHGAPDHGEPDHGALVHELVLGRLTDADTVRAEQALAGCQTCRTAVAALDHPEVARGVAEGLAAFRTPATRPAGWPAGHRWPLRAAAALALATAGVAAWTAREGLPGRDGARPGEVILAEDLENGDLGELHLGEQHLGEQQGTPRRPDVIFADDLESGGLGAWRSSS